MQDVFLVYRITQGYFMLLHELLYNTDQAEVLPIQLNSLVTQFAISTTPSV